MTTPSNNGIVNYTFTRGIPEDAKGSFTVGVNGYRNITLQPGTTEEITTSAMQALTRWWRSRLRIRLQLPGAGW